jgi:sialic acid synthase SpsE
MSVLFGCPVGISDHSMDPELVPLTGLIAGATVLEKHFCLSRTDPGLDDPIALDPALFDTMTRSLRALEAEPLGSRRGLLDERFGSLRVEAVLGTGRKVLAPAEKSNYERTNRSLHVLENLPAGHRLAAEDFAELRTEKVLRPGLAPHWRPTLEGARLARDVEAGQGLVWDDLLL